MWRLENRARQQGWQCLAPLKLHSSEDKVFKGQSAMIFNCHRKSLAHSPMPSDLSLCSQCPDIINTAIKELWTGRAMRTLKCKWVCNPLTWLQDLLLTPTDFGTSRGLNKGGHKYSIIMDMCLPCRCIWMSWQLVLSEGYGIIYDNKVKYVLFF